MTTVISLTGCSREKMLLWRVTDVWLGSEPDNLVASASRNALLSVLSARSDAASISICSGSCNGSPGRFSIHRSFLKESKSLIFWGPHNLCVYVIIDSYNAVV